MSGGVFSTRLGPPPLYLYSDIAKKNALFHAFIFLLGLIKIVKKNTFKNEQLLLKLNISENCSLKKSDEYNLSMHESALFTVDNNAEDNICRRRMNYLRKRQSYCNAAKLCY